MANEENKTSQSQAGHQGRPALGSVEKPKNFSKSMRKILKEILQYPASFAVVIVTALLSTIFSIVGPKELGKAITELFKGLMLKIQGQGDIDFTTVGRILLFVLALYVISSIFGMVQGYIMSTITQEITFDLRQRMIQKINKMPMAYFESRPYGEVLSRITNDIDTLSNGMNQSITTLITSLVTMLGILYMMLTISWKMTLIVLLIIPLSMGVLASLMKFSQQYFKQQQKSLGIINGQIEENIAGQTIVRAFNQESKVLADFNVENESLKESAWKSQFFSGLMFPIMDFISNLGYVGVVISGVYFAIHGQITVGDIQAFTQYVNRFTQPMGQMAQVVTMLQSMAAAGERVYELLEEEQEISSSETELPLAEVDGQISFDHVQFAYQPGHPIIHNFSAEIQPGQKIALVGPTGAGKSTIVKLLMRFYEVNQGEIRLDQHNILDYDRESYRQSIAMVLQDTWLFKGTIRDNIRYGRLDASDEEVMTAAKQARAHHFIEALPQGYDFEINEEASNISQGQKQLLTIARAILADRPVLILDEATSSVDTRTEVLIQEAMDELMVGRTSFIIAHRLSTIRNADLILYMEKGDIVEQGNHDQLMALNGKYSNLYQSQFINTEGVK